jgi:hypothetical protein
MRQNSQNGNYLKINPECVTYFFVVEKCPSSDQLYHTFHHNFTIKTPRVAAHFSQKPLQKPQKTYSYKKN